MYTYRTPHSDARISKLCGIKTNTSDAFWEIIIEILILFYEKLIFHSGMCGIYRITHT